VKPPPGPRPFRTSIGTEDELLTCEEVAEILRKGLRTVQDMCAGGELAHVWDGRYKVYRSEVTRWIRAHTVQRIA